MDPSENKPWITQDSFTLLNQLIKKDFVCFEFGAGGSTVWLSGLSERVFSVEHHPGWATIVEKRLRDRNIPNVELTFVSRENDEYSNFISKFDNEYFDLVFVDGRDRVKCIKNSISKLKPDGILVLDNSDRSRYDEGKESMRSWKRTDTSNDRWSTTIWFKPRS